MPIAGDGSKRLAHGTRASLTHHRRQASEGTALPLDTVKNPVLPQALQGVFGAVPLPKKAPAETLGGIPELLEAGKASLALAGVAEAPAGAPQPGKLEIARAAPEGAVTVMVLLTVSVTVVAAAQPAAPPAGFWKSVPPTGDEFAGSTVTVVVVAKVWMVVAAQAEVIASLLTAPTGGCAPDPIAESAVEGAAAFPPAGVDA